ncbi:phage baseplate assembly protein V [Taibaiella koreensis]|uniref:phage baseplate assembly protein V n=1 Tax=Taibaiella koreensis TaxID=1268548 RepID=UPI000E59BC86|nr:phage baseplate assembly protein V [Taibaiella koreensis]
MSNKVKITISGQEGEIQFSSLMISQRLCDVNSFSFIWRDQQDQEVTLNTYKAFYDKNLGAEVNIGIDEQFTFKGLIQGISCFNQYQHNIEYEITGSGLPARLDGMQHCTSWSGKTLQEIVRDIAPADQIKNEPTCSETLYYTVQYNQTAFEFLSMMAARHGQWFFYDGTKMVLGKPEGMASPQKITLGRNTVFDVRIRARIFRPEANIVGFDRYKGEKTAHNKDVPDYGGTGLVDTGAKKGKAVFGKEYLAHYVNSANQNLMGKENELHQHAQAAASTFLHANSYLSQIRIGSAIQLEESNGTGAGTYIVTEIYHSSSGVNNYQNQFSAIPAENQAPPYTNPDLYAWCYPQPAVVKQNEDKDGLARVKVQFPWQPQNETSPWLSVVVPHAGNGKGFRFLPELEDEVMVDFVNNNAERPFVMGAVYSEKNKSGVPADGNDVKIIGSRTGRMIAINDKLGMITLVDNVFEKDEYGLQQTKNPSNDIALVRKGEGADDIYLSLSSNKDDDNWSYLQFTNGKELRLSLISDGENIASLLFSKDGKKINIHSKGVINLSSDQSVNIDSGEINLNAQSINLNAKQKITMSGKEAIEAAGGQVAIKADTELKLEGMQSEVKGSTMLDLQGGSLAQLQGSLVKIN